MRILIIRNSVDYVDVKHNTYNIQEIGLARALEKKGHDCDVVFFTPDEECAVTIPVTTERSITVFYKTGKSVLYNAVYSNIDTLISQYDVIQTAEYSMYESWRMARKYPQKTVVYHGPYFSGFNRKYNLLCRFFDVFCARPFRKNNIHFLTKSEMASDFLRSRKMKNVHTVGVGIDLDALTPNHQKKIPEEVVHLEKYNGFLKLLYVGRWDERRNILFLFDVFCDVLETIPDAVLIMIGSPRTGEYGDRCIAYAKEKGIYDHLVIIPRLEQCFIQNVYKISDIFLLPTLYEIFGMVLLEAMYFNLPCITTENGGSQMLINNGETGVILPLDEKMWSNEIITLYGNESYRKSLAYNAHHFISENYTWDKVSETFLREYEQVMRGIAE